MKHRIISIISMALVATSLCAQDRAIRPITVQHKLALVVGNARYSRSPLVNPLNDAASVAAELRTLGFTVTTGNNLTLREFSRLVDEFSARLQTGDLALFYYSGHGMQVERENYLLPIDFEAASEADVPYAAYPANRIRDKLEKSGARLRLMILDACRDNPYKASRGGPNGLAPMGSTAEGTLIAFATGDNNTASDNPGQNNGLFTQHLLATIHQPGLELHDIFKRVKEEVYYGSGKRQNPFTYEDIAGSFYFRPGTPAPIKRDGVSDAWEIARISNDPAVIEGFLKECESCEYAAAARLRLASLRSPARAPEASLGTPRKMMIGSVDISHFAGLTAGDTYDKAIAIFGKPTKIEGDSVKFGKPLKHQGKDSTITGFEVTFDPPTHKIISVMISSSETGGVLRVAGADPILGFFGKSKPEILQSLGPPQQEHTSPDLSHMVWHSGGIYLTVGMVGANVSTVLVGWPIN